MLKTISHGHLQNGVARFLCWKSAANNYNFILLLGDLSSSLTCARAYVRDQVRELVREQIAQVVIRVYGSSLYTTVGLYYKLLGEHERMFAINFNL